MKTWLLTPLFALVLLSVPGCQNEPPERFVEGKAEGSCVRFVCIKNDDVATGSGFLVSDQGHVVTNNHVIAGADMIFLLHRTGDQIRLYSGKVLTASREADLAVVASSIKSPGLAINMADVKKSEVAYSIGYPGVVDKAAAYPDLVHILVAHAKDPALEAHGVDITADMGKTRILQQLIDATFDEGRVNRTSNTPLAQVDDHGKIVTREVTDSKGNKHKVLDMTGRDVYVIEHNLNIRHGNSGGPLIDQGGYVIGVVGQANSDEDSGDKVTYAISAKLELTKLLSDVGVPFNKVLVDAKAGFNLSRLTPAQQLLVSFAVACAVIAMGLGVYLLLRKQRYDSPPTTVIRQWMQKAGGGSLVPDGPAPGPGARGQRSSEGGPKATVMGPVWEIDLAGPGGFQQKVRMTEKDFARGQGRIIVGRSKDFTHVQVRHESVSRQHLHFELRDHRIAVADRNSSNGTDINGARLPRPFQHQELHEGDRVRFGELEGTLRRGL